MEFTIGIIGSFSGGSSDLALGERRFVEIDRDDFMDVFRRFAPRVELDLPFCPEIAIDDWEGLHPDALVVRVPALARLLEARDAVDDPRRMKRAIAESGVDLPIDEPRASSDVSDPARAPIETTESGLLDSILGGEASNVPVRVKKGTLDPTFDRMVSEIVGDAAVHTDHATLDRRRSAIDGEIAARMRAILRAPGMQAFEARWRALRDLVWHARTGESLRIRLIDVSPSELRVELAQSERIQDTLLYRRIVEEEREGAAGQPFGLLLFDTPLGAEQDDLLLAAYLSVLAGLAEAPVVAGASPALWAGEDRTALLGPLVEKLRTFPGAERFALCVGRVLARLPYGADSKPIDRFAFEENPHLEVANALWAQGGWSVARVAAAAFDATGQVEGLRRFTRLEGLPFHAQRRDGEVESIGPTDRFFNDSEIEALTGLGVVPVAGKKGGDEAYVASFRSLTGEALFRV